MHVAPTWADFMLGWDLGLYANPILCAAAAGCVLGFLSVYVVLRRMVFVSAAISQAAGLGVALAFYAAIHLGMTIDPALAAVV
ncbi:MAG TPA: metal ABC transporter permease, partial [Kofleriaceae bacterium]|nr:metal ABC transporter permease [Kofleriaceae bacterium]